jgi:hypothetical protein
MKTTGLNFLISDKPDLERDSVAEAFAERGGAVHRIGRFGTRRFSTRRQYACMVPTRSVWYFNKSSV